MSLVVMVTCPGSPTGAIISAEKNERQTTQRLAKRPVLISDKLDLIISIFKKASPMPRTPGLVCLLPSSNDAQQNTGLRDNHATRVAKTLGS
jgi:hypothetical protein